ncbi:MAG: phage portal protein [Pseudoclavibacter sp.]
MNLIERIATWTGITRAAEIADASAALPSPAVLPPARDRHVGSDVALSLSMIFRSIQVLCVGVSQLGMKQWRGSQLITPSRLVANPDPSSHRKAFLDYTVASLALNGNAFWLVTRVNGAPVALQPLNPAEVAITTPYGEIVPSYSYRGKTYSDTDIRHLRYLRVPGHDRGLGPIQAAAAEIQGALDGRDYRARQFRDSEYPTGVLTSDQELSPDQAKLIKKMWRGYDFETQTYEPQGKSVRVLGKGTSYDPILLSPADMQYLEGARFDTTQIARLFGTPASLMLAAVEGSSQTYANVEQDWIAFTRFTLQMYTGEIEQALSDLLPLGNSVKFNLDALQRSDTKTRYEAHKLALDGGWLSPNDVRAMEGLPPIADGDTYSRAPRSPQQEALTND